MLLNQLKVTNFGPFYSDHVILLDVSPSAPVTIIHGENMRGKTSLMNAIRWCLYGDAMARAGRRMPTVNLINIDALASGELYMSVTLDFTHHGIRYELERHVQSTFRPTLDAHLENKASLKRDGQFVAERNIQETIAGILHDDIARFFLFDGEMLDHYEALVTDPDTRTDLLRQSIERILGLPAIRGALEDLDSLLNDATRRQRRAVRQANKARKLSRDADKVETTLITLEADITDLESQKERYQQRIDELNEQRRKHLNIESDVQQAEELDDQIAQSERQLEQLRKDIQSLIADAWAEPAATRASSLLQTLETEHEHSRVAEHRTRTLDFQIKSLRRVLNERTCPVCGHKTDRPERDDIQVEVANLIQKRDAIEFSAEDYDNRATVIRDLREFTSNTKLQIIREKEMMFRRVKLQARKLKRQLDDTAERLRDHNRTEVRRVQQEYEKLVGDLRELNNDLSEKAAYRKESRADQSRIAAEISKLPEADSRIATESSIYSALKQGYSATVQEFRDSLRTVVERQASEIFRRLTTEHDYDRLVINDQYGLAIFDSDGNFIRERSAGAEQVVALALIAALNRSAVREGPIVMDTPFGRLDTVHRKNILRFIPTMGSQVVLMVQSGEFDIDRDLRHLDGKIARQYRLVRDGRPTRSRIERLAS